MWRGRYLHETRGGASYWTFSETASLKILRKLLKCSTRVPYPRRLSVSVAAPLVHLPVQVPDAACAFFFFLRTFKHSRSRAPINKVAFINCLISKASATPAAVNGTNVSDYRSVGAWVQVTRRNSCEVVRFFRDLIIFQTTGD